MFFFKDCMNGRRNVSGKPHFSMAPVAWVTQYHPYCFALITKDYKQQQTYRSLFGC